MNKILLIISCLFMMTSVDAQKKTKSETVGDSKSLYGVLTVLTKEQTSYDDYPRKLTYWDAQRRSDEAFRLPRLTRALSAKKGKADDADYFFTLITSGIQNEYYGSLMHLGSAGNRGKVIEFNYYFPCKLQVSDRQGNVLKTFILDDGTVEHSSMVHPDFLKEPEFGKPATIPVTTGFMMPDEKIMELIEKQEVDYFSRLEYNALYGCMDIAQNIIMAGYGIYNSRKPYIYMLDKSEKSQYSEMNEQIEKFAATIEEVFTKPLDEELQKRLVNSAEYFDESHCPPDASKGVKENIFGYNPAFAWLLSGDIERAYSFLVKKDGWFGGGFASEVFEYCNYANQLRKGKDKDIIEISKALSVRARHEKEEQDLKMAEWKAANAKLMEKLHELKSRNIDTMQGYIVTKTGEKIEGKISIAFIVPRSGMVDLDKGKIVRIDKKIYRSNKISHLVVGERTIVPLGIELSTASKFIDFAVDGKIPKSSGSLVLLERVYQNGDYSAFYDPAFVSESDHKLLYIRIKDDSKVKPYSEILEGKKVATNFLQSCNCESLVDKIKANEFENNIDGVKKFIDALQNCVK